MEQRNRKKRITPNQMAFIKRWGAILGVITTLYALFGHLHSDIQAGRDQERKDAVEQFKLEQQKKEYRDRNERFKDSVRKSIIELDLKNHIKPKF